MIKMAILAHDGYQSVRMGPVELVWNLRLTIGINGSGLVMLDHNGSFGLFLGIIGSCWVLLDHNLCLVIGFNGA